MKVTERQKLREDSYPMLFGPQFRDFIEGIELETTTNEAGHVEKAALVFNGTQRIEILGDLERIGY